MTVFLRVLVRQRVMAHVIHGEGRHERCTLVDAAGPFRDGQLFQALARKREFVRIVFPPGDSLELGAGSVQVWSLADDASPAGVMPRDADREMSERELGAHFRLLLGGRAWKTYWPLRSSTLIPNSVPRSERTRALGTPVPLAISDAEKNL